VKGIGSLPAPVPLDRACLSLGYLYSTGPQIWDLAAPSMARGHGGGAVALFVPPKIAALLLQYYAEVLNANQLGTYSPWDSGIGYWLNKRGVESYIPYRHYGEHGGTGNPEHALFGLGRAPRADVLDGDLAFLPVYARGSRLRYLKTRLLGRVWGLLRLVSGRLLTWHDLKRSDRRRLLRFAAGRFFLRCPSRGE
jgi:hypothetical protein